MTDNSLRVERVVAPVRLQVLEKLREAIIDGQFPPGSRLIEREICEMTGVSRTSVREAFRQLESEGLVQIQPNRGPIVSRVERREAQQIFEVRGVIEGLAVELFARSASDEQVEALLEQVEEIERWCEKGAMPKIVSAKRAFYRILLEGADNPIVTQVLEGLHARVSVLRVTSLSTPGRPQQTAREFRSMADAIAARDEARAAAACRTHVQMAAQAAVEALTEADAAR